MRWLAADDRKQYSCFRSNLIFVGRVKARPADRNFGRGRSAAGLHASLDSFYRTARDRRQDRSGVTLIPLRLLPRRCPFCGNQTIIGHGRRRKQALRSATRLDLDSARAMSTVPEDIHLSSHLVASLRTLQLLLPATSLGVQLRKRRRLGAIDAPHERSQSLSRSSHTAALGLSKIA